MHEPPKPFFRKQTVSWYCSIRGKQIPLGEEKAADFKKFYELMSSRPKVQAGTDPTVYELSQVYLDCLQKNRKRGTYLKQLEKLRTFIESAGRSLRVSEVKKFHLTAWIEKQVWATTTQADGISIVQRLFTWAVEEGYIAASPIAMNWKAATPSDCRG